MKAPSIPRHRARPTTIADANHYVRRRPSTVASPPEKAVRLWGTGAELTPNPYLAAG